jgi:hypothetical protein
MAQDLTERKRQLEDEFYKAVGQGITEWSAVDEILFEIFLDIFCAGADTAAPFGPKKQHAAIIFYRQPTMNIRLEMTDELICSILPKPEKKDGGHDHADKQQWGKLKKDIDKLLADRRTIAHFPAKFASAFLFKGTRDFVPIGQKVSLDEAGFVSGYWLYVSHAEALRGKHNKAKLTTTSDIVDHVTKLREVTEQIKTFHKTKLSVHLRALIPPTIRPPSAPNPGAVRLTIGLGKRPRA